MTRLSHRTRRLPAIATTGLLALSTLTCAINLAHAQTSNFKPQVLHRFNGTADAATPGAVPQVPPLPGADGRLRGTTYNGGPFLAFVVPSGTAYSLDAAGGNFRSVVLGNIGASTTTLVADAAGNLIGGAASSNYQNDTTTNLFASTTAMFSIRADMPTPFATRPTTGPRGQIAMDDGGAVYFGGGITPATCGSTINDASLWRLNSDGSYARVVNFCRFATGTGTTELHPKGGLPVASVWSAADQALYVLTAVGARGVFDATATTDNAGRSVGTLVKISKAALETGAASNGVVDAAQVELLHTFLRARDGAPDAAGGRITGLVEAGQWLYGTSMSNAPTAGTVGDTRYSGTLWRVKKSDPASFTVLHYFRGTTTVAADGTAQADGGTPGGPLVVAADGNVYGTTTRDGSTLYRPTTGVATPVGAGTLFRVVVGQAADHSDDRYEVLHRFDLGTDGGRPTGLSAGPVSGGVQKLYGAASAGGQGQVTAGTSAGIDPAGNGTVFSVDVAAPTVAFSTALSASATSVTVGDSLTLTWATQNAASCTAGGDNGSTWSGAQQTNGSQVPLSAALNLVGANSFSLTCQSNNGGPSVTQSVNVTVAAKATTPTPTPTPTPVTETPAPATTDSGGGGGPFSAWLLAPLAGLVALRRRIVRS